MYFYVQRARNTSFSFSYSWIFYFLWYLQSWKRTRLLVKKTSTMMTYTQHIFFLLFFDIFNFFFSSLKFSLKNLITICDTWKIHHIMEQRPDTSRPFSSIGYSSSVRFFFCSFSISAFNLGLFLYGFSRSSLDFSWMMQSGSNSDSADSTSVFTLLESGFSVFMPSLVSSFAGEPGADA